METFGVFITGSDYIVSTLMDQLLLGSAHKDKQLYLYRRE